MVKCFSRQVTGALVVTLALMCPVVEANVGGVFAAETKKAISAFGKAVQKLTARSTETLVAGAAVVTLCTGLASCDQLEHILRGTTTGLTETEGIEPTLPIMQGATSATQTQMFVLTEADKNYSFKLATDSGREVAPSSLKTSADYGSAQVVHQVYFQGLGADTQYLLRVYDTDKQELVDERWFSTLATGKQQLRFAIASCMWDMYRPWDAGYDGDIWHYLIETDPDVILFVGDNVYVDMPFPMTSPAGMWQKYVSTRQKFSFFKNKKLIPVVSTWDDHDYGFDNSNRHWPLKDAATDIFRSFFIGQQTDNYRIPDIGVAGIFDIYGHTFFMMDNRSFRTAPGEEPQRHFGDEQMQWLLDNLHGRDRVFIASGSQFFGGYAYKEGDQSLTSVETFQGEHPERFAYFIKQLRNSGVEVVFLSGDRHYSEVLAIPEGVLGYQTYEITSSPINMIPQPFPDIANPLRVAGYENAHNFLVVEVQDLMRKGMKLNVSAHGLGGEVAFNNTYTISNAE